METKSSEEKLNEVYVSNEQADQYYASDAEYNDYNPPIGDDA